MRKEFIDPNSGAIIIKRSKEVRMIEILSRKVKELESRIKVLEEKMKEDS